MILYASKGSNMNNFFDTSSVVDDNGELRLTFFVVHPWVKMYF